MLETFIQYLIVNRVPEFTIINLLYLPIIALIFTFIRYLIGWRSLSVYPSILLTFALYHLAHTLTGWAAILTGLVYGGLLFIISSMVALIVQMVTEHIRLHYLSKITLAISIVTIVMFAMLGLAVYFKNYTFIILNPMSLVILIVLIDTFVRSYIRKGLHKSILLIFSTVLISFMLFSIMAQESVESYILLHPELSLVSIILTILVGSFRGLRLTEFMRFKNIPNQTFHDTEHTEE